MVYNNRYSISSCSFYFQMIYTRSFVHVTESSTKRLPCRREKIGGICLYMYLCPRLAETLRLGPCFHSAVRAKRARDLMLQYQAMFEPESGKLTSTERTALTTPLAPVLDMRQLALRTAQTAPGPPPV